MGDNKFRLQFNNEKKEPLNELKHGIRKDQVDKKFHNLFDAYDSNNDGTLEENEIQTIFGHLKNFAGDNILDSSENLKAKSVFAEQLGMQDVDFQGFIKSVSDATAEIISSEETATSDGGKEIKTEYKDGTTETIAYYPNGDVKWKKTDKKLKKTTYEVFLDNKRFELTERQFNQCLQDQQNLNDKNKAIKNKMLFGVPYEGGMRVSIPKLSEDTFNKVNLNSKTNEWEEHTQEYSPRFIAENLGVNINTKDGKNIVERMSYLPKEALEQIKDGAELKGVLLKNDLPPNFDNISNVLELMYGVTLRDEEEYEASKVQREKIIQQIQTVTIMSELYARVAEFNDTYTDNQGLFGMGAEGFGWILNKIGLQGENHYQWADSCREFIEKINDFKVLNPEKFEQEFKGLTGKDKFNIDALQKMVELSKNGKAQDEYGNYTEEFKQAVKDFSNFDVSNPNAKAWYHPENLLNGFGEALIMILTLGWGAETKAGQMLATSTMATFSKAGVAVASKQVNNKLLQGALRLSGKGVKLLGPMINEGTKMSLYTLSTGTATNVANRTIKFDSEDNTLDKFLETEGMVLDGATGSFGFGAFAGFFGTTVTQKVVQSVSRVSQKVGTALSDKFAQGAVEANEVFATILEKSAPTKIAEAAAFAVDVVGFTAFESAIAIAKNIEGFPDDVTVEDIVKVIAEEFKGQGYNLGQIKTISYLVMWLSGSRSARMQATRYMKENMPQLRGATVEGVNGGKDGYKINLPDGRKIECKNTTEYISALHLMVRGETALSSKFDMRNTNRVTETSDVSIPTQAEVKQMNFDEMFARLKNGHVNYTLSTTEDGRKLVKIEDYKTPSSNRFDYYEFDNEGKLVKSQVKTSEATAKDLFKSFENAETRNVKNRGGRLNVGVPVMDMAESVDAAITARNVRNEVGNTKTNDEILSDLLEQANKKFEDKIANFDKAQKRKIKGFYNQCLDELSKKYSGKEFETAKNMLDIFKNLIFKNDHYYNDSNAMISEIIEIYRTEGENIYGKLEKIVPNIKSMYALDSVAELLKYSNEDYNKIIEMYDDMIKGKENNQKTLINSLIIEHEELNTLYKFYQLCKANNITMSQDYICETLLKLSDEQLNNFVKRNILNNDKIKPYDIASFAVYSDEEFEIVEKRNLYKCMGNRFRNTLLKLSDEEFDKIIKIGAYNQETGWFHIAADENIQDFLNLNENQTNNAIKYHLIEKNNPRSRGSEQLLEFLDRPQEELEIMSQKGLFDIKVKDKYLDIKTIEYLNEKNLNMEIIQQILKLEDDVSPAILNNFAELSNTEIENIKKYDLFNIKVQGRTFRPSFNLDGSETFSLSAKLLTNPNDKTPVNLKLAEIYKLSKLPEKELKAMISLLKNENISSFEWENLTNIARLDEADFNYFINNLTSDFNTIRTLKNAIIVQDDKVILAKDCFKNIDDLYKEIEELSKSTFVNFEPLFYDQNGTFNIEFFNKFKEYAKLFYANKDYEKIGSDIVETLLDKDVCYTIADFDAKINFFEYIKNNPDKFSTKSSLNYLKFIDNSNLNKIVNILNSNKSSDRDLLNKMVETISSKDSFNFILNNDANELLNRVIKQKDIVLEKPKLYVNGTYPDEASMIKVVDRFFEQHANQLALAAGTLDKESLNNLLRNRFDDAEEYLRVLANFNITELNLLKDLSSSINTDFQAFKPSLKVEFIDLIEAYKSNNLSLEKIQNMVKDNKVDLNELQIDLFNQILKNSGLTDEEIASVPIEKLTTWDLKYAHLLAKEINSERDKAFADVLRAGSLEDFEVYINNENNEYGKVNAVTRQQYAELGMNYEKWYKPSTENEVHFQSKDTNLEQLEQVEKQFLEDIETLRRTPAKGFIDKQYPKCIKNGEFIIPPEFATSKAKMTEFVNGVIKALDPVWSRAKGNLENPQRAKMAQNTLTILAHLNQRLSDIEQVNEIQSTKTYDLTIKMWDRIPQKDIFQGNYSTCCIGMGGGNGRAMPYYLMDTAYNMIEIVDNNGKTIGNALCYFVKEANGKPAFIIDNIEINNARKPSDEISIELRNAIVEYATNVTNEVVGEEGTSIYMGKDYNDVHCDDLPVFKNLTVQFIGDINREEIYMDLYKDKWVDKSKLKKPQKVELLKLK